MDFLQDILKYLYSFVMLFGFDSEKLDLVSNVIGLLVTFLSFVGMIAGFIYTAFRFLRFAYRGLVGVPPRDNEEILSEMVKISTNGSLDPIEKEAHLALIAKLIVRAEQDKDRRFKEALEEVLRWHPSEAEDILQKIAEEKASEHIKAAKQASEAYQMIGVIAFFHDTPRALAAYEHAMQLDPADPEPCVRYGRLLIRIAEYDRARELFNRLQHYAKEVNDLRIEAEAYRNLSRIERKKGRLEEAKDLQVKSLQIAKITSDERGMARDYSLLGLIFSWQVDEDLSISSWRDVDAALYLDQAQSMHLECLKLSEQRNDDVGRAFSYGGLGIVELQRGNYEEAKLNIEKSLELHELVKHRVGYAKSNSALAHVYLQQGNLTKAEELYFKSIALNDETGDREGKAKNYRQLGRVAFEQQKFQVACKRWTISNTLFEELRLPHWIERTRSYQQKAGCIEIAGIAS